VNEDGRAHFGSLIERALINQRFNNEWELRGLLRLGGGAWYLQPNRVQRRLVRAFVRETPTLDNIGVRLIERIQVV
jgi:hypothetical protein